MLILVSNPHVRYNFTIGVLTLEKSTNSQCSQLNKFSVIWGGRREWGTLSYLFQKKQ